MSLVLLGLVLSLLCVSFEIILLSFGFFCGGFKACNDSLMILFEKMYKMSLWLWITIVFVYKWIGNE